MKGEKLSADEVQAILYCDEIADTIFDHGYKTDLIFNTDETSLNNKMLPSKTSAAKANQKAPGAKKFKECATVLICAKASRSF